MCKLPVLGSPHIDHIVPKPKDEAAEATPLEGLQLLCGDCHAKKSASERWQP